MIIDAVVFDVDGVLVDTDASYTEAVIRTLRTLRPEAAIDRPLIRLWRRSGNWNNDWDLAYGLYCWLSAPAPLPADAAARRTLAELEATAPPLPFNYGDVQGIFEEHYNGTRTAVERYGVAPRVHNDHPLALDEPVLLTRAIVAELAALGISKLGVVTGRVRADWDQVAGRIPLPAGVPVATDEDGRKPDPAALRSVVDRLAPRGFAVVGDTINDLRMTQAYSRVGTLPAICVIRCDSEERDGYLAAGARATIRSLAELPAALRAVIE